MQLCLVVESILIHDVINKNVCLFLFSPLPVPQLLLVLLQPWQPLTLPDTVPIWLAGPRDLRSGTVRTKHGSPVVDVAALPHHRSAVVHGHVPVRSCVRPCFAHGEVPSLS